MSALRPLFASWRAEFDLLDGIELPRRASDGDTEYRAAREAAALFDGSDRGWVEIHGADTVDFLQRILSSDLSRLPAGGGQWSALLDGKGHWVTDLLVYRFERGGMEVFGLDLPAAREPRLEKALATYHFGEQLEWRLPRPARLLVLGARAEAALRDLGVAVPAPCPEPAAAHGEFGVMPDPEGLVLRRPDRGTQCFELLGGAEAVAARARALAAAGVVPGGFETLETLRIESFQPRFGADFDEEATLPESNEWRRASLSKGCYAGQEVVAKVNTYGEAPWQLCRLRFASGDPPLAGATLRDADGKTVGRVTSWARSPQQDVAIGLGSLRRKAAVDGSAVEAHLGGRSTQAIVEVPEKVIGG